jgi:hypothetical protein
LKKKLEHSNDITLLLRTEVSHIKDRLGDLEGEFADSESEKSSDDSIMHFFLTSKIVRLYSRTESIGQTRMKRI